MAARIRLHSLVGSSGGGLVGVAVGALAAVVAFCGPASAGTAAGASGSASAGEPAQDLRLGGEDPSRLMVFLPEAVTASKAGAGVASAAERVETRLEGLEVRVRSVVPPAGVDGPPATLAAGAEGLRHLRGWHVLELTDPDQRGRVLDRLRDMPDVGAVEPAYLDEVCDVPDDAQISNQQYLGMIHAYGAYDVVHAGAGILVAIVDGGTEWRHEDLRGNVWERPGEIDGNGLDDDGNGFVDDVRGWNFADGSPDPTGLAATPRNASHGTHIAGIVSAVSDNGLGVAGVSWNARLLPVNVSHPEIDTGIQYGYEGLLYAALSGARVANASWGRTGRWSQYENDVIQTVTEMGMLVVAAAGNNVTGTAFYPAYYPGVLSVTRVGNGLEPHPLSNMDLWIDVAAPGSLIWNALKDNSYGRLGGTSQSAAVVSGVAALVAAVHRGYTPAQLREQIRWTTQPFRDVPPELENRAGTGVVDAHAAVTRNPPGLRAENLRVLDQNEDGRVEPGEVVVFAFDVVSELAGADRVRVHLDIDDPDLVPLQQTVILGRVGAGATLPITRGLSAWVRDTARLGRLIPVLLTIEADGHEVHQAFYPEVLPVHATVHAGRLEVTVTATGKIGFSHVTRPRDPGGVGIRRPGGRSTMLGGTFLIGDGPSRVSDAMISPTPSSILEDFSPQLGEAVQFPHSGRADDEVVCVYADRSSGRPVGIRVSQTSLAYREPGRDGFVLSIYDVTSSLGDRRGLRMGALVDWELPSNVHDRDQILFDASSNLVYAVSHGEDATEMAGMAILEGPGSIQWNWLYDLPPEEGTRPFLYDPQDLSRKIGDEDLWTLLATSGGDRPSETGGVASVISCGPFDLDLGQSSRMVLAYVMGRDLVELRTEAEAARIAYEGIEEGVYGRLPAQPLLLPNAPNPFNPQTEIRFTLPKEGPVRLAIYDARGRRVVSLLDQTLTAGFHRVPWAGVDARGLAVASGVYRIHLESPFGSDRRSITLIR